jgi:hypothetical protein
MTPERWKIVITALVTFIVTVAGAFTTTQVAGCGKGPPIIQPPGPPPKPEQKPDAWNAIGKLALQGAYCSGTVIGPPKSDGRWTVVSAAHCVNRVGEHATFIQRSGTSRNVTCYAINKTADISLWSTDAAQGDMAFTIVARTTPQPGTRVFHGGFGRDQPGNREEGEVVTLPNQDGQVKYHLSVSPGDSGGGICINENGELLSPVCCTTRLDGPGEVWGGSPEMINRMLTVPTEFLELPPMKMPPAPKPMPPAKGK